MGRGSGFLWRSLGSHGKLWSGEGLSYVRVEEAGACLGKLLISVRTSNECK